MRRMGGLRKYMPIVAGTFIFGWLAIAGIIPFAGFWSKDDILAKVWVSHHYALWAIGAVTALLTALYMTRQVWLVFYADERWNQPAMVAATAGTAHREEDSAAAGEPPVLHEEAPAASGAHDDAHGEPHDAPWTMAVPLLALAGLTLVGGGIDLPFVRQGWNKLDIWLAPVFRGAPEIPEPSFSLGVTLSVIALAIATVGILIGARMYGRGLVDGKDPEYERLGALAPVLANAYYIDLGLSRLVSGPVTAFASFLANVIDREVIDGAVNGIAYVFRDAGGGLRRIQTGLVRNYALGIVAGAVALVIWFATRVAL